MLKNRRLKFLVLLFIVGNITSVFFVNCSGQGGFVAFDALGGDPLNSMAWHLHNYGQAVYAKKAATPGVDMNLLNTWGQGVHGSGIKILISDAGVEDTHEDLHANFLYGAGSKDYTLPFPYLANNSPPKSDSDNHGTSVAGLAAAIAGNGKGTRGVAAKASLISANLISGAVTLDTYAKIIDQLDGDFDISNMSWGATQNLVDDDADGHNSNYEAQLKTSVTTKRGGKGAVFIKAAGNDYVVNCYDRSSAQCIGNANFDRDNANPYTIVVAAIDATGVSASYSSPGANLWISSFGGMFGSDSPAMITTDRTGCSTGESTSSANSVLGFEKGRFENTSCNYTIVFNGTSAASPTIAGAVALMLEANKSLTWRDVKYILAKTARAGTSTKLIDHPLKGSITMPSGYAWEQGWITNSAGFKFNNWYGFGIVNVDEAVSLAKSYKSSLSTYHETPWISSGSLNSAIPDYSASGVSSMIATIDSVKIEAVRIKVKITHPEISNIALELTAPSGTKSIIVNGGNSLKGLADFTGREIFLSNAFYGENSSGTWTLKVIDVVSGQTGTLNNWSINFVGGQ